MNQTAVLGWGLMFVVIGLCAFVWDRDLSIRELRRRQEAPPRKKRNWQVIVTRIVSLLGILAAGAFLWLLYASGHVSLVTALTMAMLLILACVLVRCFIWYVASWAKYDAKFQQRPTIRFQLSHLLGLTALVAFLMGFGRILIEKDTVAFNWWMIAGLSLFGILLAKVIYIGVENLFFGYGSGKRINRLRELEKEKEIRLPTRTGKKPKRRLPDSTPTDLVDENREKNCPNRDARC